MGRERLKYGRNMIDDLDSAHSSNMRSMDSFQVLVKSVLCKIRLCVTTIGLIWLPMSLQSLKESPNIKDSLLDVGEIFGYGVIVIITMYLDHERTRRYEVAVFQTGDHSFLFQKTVNALTEGLDMVPGGEFEHIKSLYFKPIPDQPYCHVGRILGDLKMEIINKL